MGSAVKASGRSAGSSRGSGARARRTRAPPRRRRRCRATASARGGGPWRTSRTAWRRPCRAGCPRCQLRRSAPRCALQRRRSASYSASEIVGRVLPVVAAGRARRSRPPAPHARPRPRPRSRAVRDGACHGARRCNCMRRRTLSLAAVFAAPCRGTTSFLRSCSIRGFEQPPRRGAGLVGDGRRRRACGRSPRAARASIASTADAASPPASAPAPASLAIRKCLSARAATCGAWVTAITCTRSASRASRCADGVRHRAADAGVDLVEDQRRRRAAIGQRHLQRQHEARELAAGRDLHQRPGRVPGLVCTQNSTRSKPSAGRGWLVASRSRTMNARALELQRRQFAVDRLFQRRAALPARGAERSRRPRR